MEIPPETYRGGGGCKTETLRSCSGPPVHFPSQSCPAFHPLALPLRNRVPFCGLRNGRWRCRGLLRRERPDEAPLFGLWRRDGGAALFEGLQVLGAPRTGLAGIMGRRWAALASAGGRGPWRGEEAAVPRRAHGEAPTHAGNLESSDPAEQGSRCWRGKRGGGALGSRTGGFSDHGGVAAALGKKRGMLSSFPTLRESNGDSVTGKAESSSGCVCGVETFP